MKIFCTSTWDPRDPSSWSGSALSFITALEAHPDVELEIGAPLAQVLPRGSSLKRRAYDLLGKNFLPEIHPNVLRANACQLESLLARSSADVIVSLDKMPIAYLNTDKPIIYFWDCTWEGNLEYPWFADLAKESVHFGHDMERRALQNCRLAVFSSEWARESAVEYYGTPREKTRVVPLGANLTVRRTIGDVEKIVDSRTRPDLMLLWMGVDWKRKGGDLAFQVAEELNRRGRPTTLTVVGCDPRLDVVPSFVEAHGFINKRTHQSIIDELFSKAHFLVLPSLAEASACVMCEASSFGTPSLSRRIGGIPGTVRDGVNGQLFDRHASAAEYCDYILATVSDWDRYRSLCMSSFKEYEANLNWANTADKLLYIIRNQVMT